MEYERTHAPARDRCRESDLGGGRITVTLSTDAPVEPWLTVTNASGGASGTSNEHVRKNVFEAAPGQVHVAEVFEFFKAPREAHPWPYDIS